MAAFTITANGTEMGTYEAADEQGAILAYVQDAGYSSIADAADALSQTEDEFLSDIAVA